MIESQLHPTTIEMLKARELEGDKRAMNRRIEKALQARVAEGPLRANAEGQAEIQAIIKGALEEYYDLVEMAPSVLLQFYLASNRFLEGGTCAQCRILIRFDLTTGKVESCTTNH